MPDEELSALADSGRLLEGLFCKNSLNGCWTIQSPIDSLKNFAVSG